jgi:hypothetical protein
MIRFAGDWGFSDTKSGFRSAGGSASFSTMYASSNQVLCVVRVSAQFSSLERKWLEARPKNSNFCSDFKCTFSKI